MKQQKPDSKIFGYLKIRSIAALFIGAAILVYGCENDLEKIKAFSSQDTLPMLEATGFETLFTDSGTVRYLLKTPKLMRFENEGKEFVEFPEGVEIVQYDANKKIVSSLTADYAKQFVKEEKWEAKNNVVATNLEGDTLKTDHLIWEEKTKQIYTEEFVRIIRTDGVFAGYGLTADESLANWKIKKMTGDIYVTVDDKKSKRSGNNASQPPIKEQKNKPFDGPVKFEK